MVLSSHVTWERGSCIPGASGWRISLLRGLMWCLGPTSDLWNPSKSKWNIVSWQLGYWKSEFCWERMRTEMFWAESGSGGWGCSEEPCSEGPGSGRLGSRCWDPGRSSSVAVGWGRTLGGDMWQLRLSEASMSAQQVKNLPAMQETWEMQIWSLGWDDPLEEKMATHCSILAWRIPWTGEPGGLQSMGSQRVRHDWAPEHAHRQGFWNNL